VQAARGIQTKRFSNNGSSDIVCNANLRVGEIRQFCKLQDARGDETIQSVSDRTDLPMKVPE
jgi:hypothetical protein